MKSSPQPVRCASVFCALFLALGAAASTALASGPGVTAFSSVPGAYLIDSDALVMTGPDGFQADGVFSDGYARFLFSDFLLNVGASITTVGSRPVSISSQSELIVGGLGITAQAGGAPGGLAAMPGAGLGGGFPGSGSQGSGGGGGYGGPGGAGMIKIASVPGQGGFEYGDLLALQAGSGGGGSTAGNSTTGNALGGAGGGAIELRAMGLMLIAGNGVRAEGFAGEGLNSFAAGGGGSGGGIRLLAQRIINTSTISAAGGSGGVGTFSNGGGGGGGRIYIAPGSGGFLDLGETTARGGFAGSSFFGTSAPGSPGIVTIVPEPSGLLAGLLAFAALVQRRPRG